MNEQKSIVEYLQQENVQSNIQSAMKDRANQFVTSVTSLVSSNKALAEVDKKSLLAACITAASLDLPINQNLGFAYIIPYGNSAQFQMGWKGFVQLAIRTKRFKYINVSDVREGEYLGVNRLSGQIEFKWVDSEEDRSKLKTIGYVAYFELTEGYSKMNYMTIDQIEKHGKRYSQTYKKGFGVWKDDFDSMARKTVLKLLLSKYAPLSSELEKAIVADQAEGQGEYVDNKKINPLEEGALRETERILKHIEDAKTVEFLEKVSSAVDGQSESIKEKYLEKLTELSK